ncbi:hypothetical protein MMC07_009381 [Pseudocyphellaria aurata]|nr:hypothetical protein [Pseudocyphellaria aurata]
MAFKPFPDSDCEDEHISRARHISSFYKSHFQIIDNLICHHDNERRARLDAEERAASFERRFNESEAKRKDLSSKLEANTADLKKTKENLQTTNQKLDATKKELTTTQANLNEITEKFNTSESKLHKTADDLKATKKTLQQTSNELKEAKERRVKETVELEKKLAEANKGEKAAKADVLSLTKKNNDLEDRKDAAEERQREAERDAERKVDKARKNLQAAEDRANKFFRGSNRKAGKFYLDLVVYGGVEIENKAVIDTLLKHAVHGTSFTISNDLLGGDPWAKTDYKGKPKTFTAFYAVNDQGPFESISQLEGQPVKFE